MLAANDEMFRRDVAALRREFLEKQFGPVPAEMQQLRNLLPIWPDGGMYAMTAAHLGGLGLCITHGLTNPDLPVRQRPAPDQPGRFEPRAPRQMPPGLAGYGYELAILTPQPDPWPLLTLNWFVQMEMLNDLGLIEIVAAANGATAESVPVGDAAKTAHFLVQPACAPVAARVKLPHGLMHLLIATWITEDEMNFARQAEDGRFVLLNKLVDAGVGPVSRPGRPSVAGVQGGG